MANDIRLVIVGSIETAWPIDKVPKVKDLIRTVFEEHWQISDVRDDTPEGHEAPPALVIGSGESPAGGVDIWVRETALELGLPFKAFPPMGRNDWPAYKARNNEMADWCTHLVRIASMDSKTYGSGWTRDQAARQGKPTREYRL